MIRAILILAALLSALPARAQAGGTEPQTDPNQPQAGAAQQGTGQQGAGQQGAGQPAADVEPGDEGMAVPPPVSGEAFPVAVGAEERSNYLSIGVLGEAGYVTNVFAGYLGDAITTPVNDETYVVAPTVQFDRTDLRLHESLFYSPAFIFFQHTTALNQATQSARGALDFRLSPHSTIDVHDSFIKTDNAFGAPASLSGGTITGAAGAPTLLAIAPFADQISNEAGGLYSYQFSRNGMVGGGGGVAELDYPNSREAAGLYNSNSYNSNVFYSERLTRRQFGGVTASYFNITEYPTTGSNGNTQTIGFLPFYTFNPRKNVLFSVSAGPQYYNSSDPPFPSITGWAPEIVTSAHVEMQRATVSFSYQRTVTAGGGLLGAFVTNTAGAQLRVLLSRTWNAGLNGNYSNNKELMGSNFGTAENGHTITGAASIVHILTPHLTAEVGYDFLHQSYEGIEVLAAAPNSQKVYGTLQYQLRRPLGR